MSCFWDTLLSRINKDDIQSNRDHLNSLKNKTSSEWREYATQCMIEIMNNK